MLKELETLTADNCGCSELALNAAKAIMSLDGLRPVRQTLTPDYDVRAFTASWARMIDREFFTGLKYSLTMSENCIDTVTPGR